MSDAANPWQSPGTEISAVKQPGVSGGLSETMVFYLKGASPWLRFVGILSFIGCGLLTVIGILVMIFGSVFSDLAAGLDSDQLGIFQMGVTGGIFLGLVYIILGLLCYFPARFIYGFGVRIRSYLLSNAEKDLEEAFKNNKSLWKFTGILAIVYLGLIPVAIIIGVIVMIALSLA
jgi:hypothetical protein